MDTGQGQMCDEGEEDLIQILFPANYAYKVMNCNATEYKGKYIQCNIELRVNVNNKESVKRFLSDFKTSSACSYNLQSGKPDKRPAGDSARSQF